MCTTVFSPKNFTFHSNRVQFPHSHALHQQKKKNGIKYFHETVFLLSTIFHIRCFQIILLQDKSCTRLLVGIVVAALIWKSWLYTFRKFCKPTQFVFRCWENLTLFAGVGENSVRSVGNKKKTIINKRCKFLMNLFLPFGFERELYRST